MLSAGVHLLEEVTSCHLTRCEPAGALPSQRLRGKRRTGLHLQVTQTLAECYSSYWYVEHMRFGEKPCSRCLSCLLF